MFRFNIKKAELPKKNQEIAFVHHKIKEIIWKVFRK